MSPGPVEMPETQADREREQDNPQPPRPERESMRRAPQMRRLQDQVRDLYANIGLMFVTPIDPLGGALLVKRADTLADSWVQLAESDPKVKEILQRAVSVGGWGAVVAGHAAVVLPVLVNRGALPDPVANAVAVSTLMEDPDLRPYFTHPRFQNQPAAAQAESAEGNGDGT